MSDKIALITGANKGLGFETARQLAKEGITVLAASRNAERGTAAVKQLKEEGLPVEFLQLDVNNPADIENAFDYISNNYGKLDILVNNAGIQVESDDWGINNTLSVTDEDLRATFDTNFFNVVKLTNKLLPLLRKSEAGRIVNLSSILGSLGLHSKPGSPIYTSKLFAYDSSKAALNSFTIHLAHALADTKIKVNSAHPGWVKTDMGSDAAPMNIPEGVKTTVSLALLDEDGPSGKFIHLGKELPW